LPCVEGESEVMELAGRKGVTPPQFKKNAALVKAGKKPVKKAA
jgi:hypothetical protein